MPYLDEVITRIPDHILRAEISAEIMRLRGSLNFGLVFERHTPERIALRQVVPMVGRRVALRRDDANSPTFIVIQVSESTATIRDDTTGQEQVVQLGEIVVLHEIGQPIYPTLTPLGSQMSSSTKPSHVVVEGENYYALQLLAFACRESVDCIYIDPPYNTGAKDWRYNNRFVDANDQWRHSKWLSFMERRLRLSRRLLKKDGVLIVTIDEHEVHHLGMLLEEVFPDAYRQMVTIVINPKGVTQARFSRVEEYALFCFLGDAAVSGFGDDLLTSNNDTDNEDEDEVGGRIGGPTPRWKGLLRSGEGARREDRKNMFYPVLIDTVRGAVLGAGEPLPFDEDPDFDTPIEGLTPVWPVRDDASLGRWSVGHHTLRDLASKGYVRVGKFDPRRRTWGLTYLSRRQQSQVASGVLQIVSYDEIHNAVVVRHTDPSGRRIKTVWHRSRHDAGAGGTDVLRALLGERAFPYPKSVYAVQDTLAAIVGTKRDAVILDPFAGSGTTLHATALLNAADGGSRRCILISNNEVEEATAGRLRQQGLYPGDTQYEAAGIFEAVTRPRCEAVITGRRPDGSPVPGVQIGGRPFADGFDENVEFFRLEYLDRDRVELGREYAAVLPTLWLKAGARGARCPDPEPSAPWSIPEGAAYAVLFDEAKIRPFRTELERRPGIQQVYLVTDSEEAYAEMCEFLQGGWRTDMLYRDYLRNFRLTGMEAP